MNFIKLLKFNSEGLIPVVVEDYKTNKVIMFAYMSKKALKLTIRQKKAHYWSRSRKKLWLKGETSGHTQIVKELYTDCDYDVILLKVDQIGGIACHTGRSSCFFNKIDNNKITVVESVIKDPKLIYGK